MRLLNATSLTLDDFPDHKRPPYAVLSHRWLETKQEEVSFEDLRHNRGTIGSKQGFKKIQHCCTQAIQDRIDWIWVDTCCT